MTDIAPVIELPFRTLAEVRAGIEDLAELFAESGDCLADTLLGAVEALRFARCGCARDLPGAAASVIGVPSATLAEVRNGIEALAGQKAEAGDPSAGVLLFAVRALWLVRCSCESTCAESQDSLNTMIAACATSAPRTGDGD